MASSGTLKVKQLYDENGNPFYPLTLIDVVLGDKTKLLNLGNSVSIVDLSKYLITPLTGTLKLYIMNSLVYSYEGNITYTESGTPLVANTDIVIARDIPSKYRSADIVKCSAVQSISDIVNVYVSPEGSIIARVTPKAIRNEDANDYVSSMKRLYFNGLFLRNGMVE